MADQSDKADDYAFGIAIGLGTLVGGGASYYWGKPLSVAISGGILALWYAVRLALLPGRNRG